MRAVVVCHDHGDHWAARWLKPGFRHVFVVVEAAGYWVLVDPKAGRPEIAVLAGADYDVAAFYRDQGFAVAETTVTAAPPPPGPVVLANCVGAVKAVLGLRAPLCLTPHQLFKRVAR